MTAPKAAVIGTGRSGTGYVAALLRANGVTTGHEQWWNPQDARTQDLDVDVSWLALPEIEAGAWTGPVVHVIRPPKACIESLAVNLFALDPSNPYRRFAMQHAGLPEGWPPDMLAASFYGRWNDRAADIAVDTIRLTDLATVEGCARLGDVIGHEITPHAIPADTNTRGPVPTIGWLREDQT